MTCLFSVKLLAKARELLQQFLREATLQRRVDICFQVAPTVLRETCSAEQVGVALKGACSGAGVRAQQAAVAKTRPSERLLNTPGSEKARHSIRLNPQNRFKFLSSLCSMGVSERTRRRRQRCQGSG